MAARQETVWRLFVDESGNFADAGEDVVVAGILAHSEAPGLRSEELRRTLEAACPGVPWPFHTSFLNAPVYLALCSLAFPGRSESGQPGPEQQSLAAAVDRARAALEQREPRETTGAVEALREGRLRFERVKHLDATLKAVDPATHGVLLAHARQVAAQIGRLADRLARQPGGPWLALCCAGESVRGEAHPREGRPRQDDSARYIAVLETLVERVVDILAGFEGEHLVFLHVLNRDILDPLLGRFVPLHVRHLSELIGRISASTGHQVRVRPEATPRFDASAHAALVLADFASNRARWHVGRPSVPLEEMEHRIGAQVGLPVRWGTPGLSHLAATGWPRRVVDAHRAAPQPSPGEAPDGTKRWAREQALEWAAALDTRP